MQQSDDTRELFQALVAFQSEAQDPRKNKTNPLLKNKYVDLNSVLEVIRPVLTQHGLAVVQMPGGDDGHISVATQLCHTSGQWLRHECAVPIYQAKGINDAQVAGSIISYLRRYSLLAALGLGAEDDDGSSAGRPRESRQERRDGPPAGQRTSGKDTPPKADFDALSTWRQGLAQCHSKANLAGWLKQAEATLPKPQQGELRAALMQKCGEFGVTIAELRMMLC